MTRLDRIDCDILAALQADGRMTNVALARQVGLSPTPCLERVKMLESAGLIGGYSARLSPAALGLGLTVFVEVGIERTAQDVFDAFRCAVLDAPEIQACHMVAGGYDYLLKVRVPDMEAYRHFVGQVLSGMPGIREMHTYPVMEEVKDLPAIALNHLLQETRKEHE